MVVPIYILLVVSTCRKKTELMSQYLAQPLFEAKHFVDFRICVSFFFSLSSSFSSLLSSRLTKSFAVLYSSSKAKLPNFRISRQKNKSAAF